MRAPWTSCPTLRWLLVPHHHGGQAGAAARRHPDVYAKMRSYRVQVRPTQPLLPLPTPAPALTSSSGCSWVRCVG
jgi:hypothetical protein